MRNEMPYALGFRPQEYLALSYVKSAQWVAGPLKDRMKSLMRKNPAYFEAYRMLGGVDNMGIYSCSKYNQGKYCPMNWHKNDKNIRQDEGQHAMSASTSCKLQLHCCVLCLEAIGVIVGHPLMDCPWIQTSTWQKVFSTQDSAEKPMETLE